VLRLPQAQLGSGEVRPLVSACLDRLQGDFGDLERVGSDPALLQRFCGLPFQAVLQLLLDERTAAASENSALALVHAWLAAQAPGAGEFRGCWCCRSGVWVGGWVSVGFVASCGVGVGSNSLRALHPNLSSPSLPLKLHKNDHGTTTAGADERRALAGAVRLPQLEPLMLATVVPRMGWLSEVLGVEGLALAAGAARGQYDVAAGGGGGGGGGGVLLWCSNKEGKQAAAPFHHSHHQC